MDKTQIARSSESWELQKEKQKEDFLKSNLSLIAGPSKSKPKKLADTIEDNFLVCRICEETFKSPKCLNCLHSFCEECLEKHLMLSEQTKYKKFISCEYRDITCPLCFKRTPLPMGGVKRLPDNFIVNGLTDVIVKQRPAEELQCDVCKVSKASSDVMAKHKCMECMKHLCGDCATFHKETKVFKNHSLFNLKLEKEVQCFDHADEVVRFYCETCEKCVCVVCTFEGHHNHEITSFDEAFSKFSQPIRDLAKQCKKKLIASEEKLEKLERCESLVRCVEQFVKDKVVEMMSDLKLRESQLLKEVRNIYGPELLNKITQKKEFVMQIENMKNSSKLTEVVLEGKNIEFLLLKKSIESKLSLINSLDESAYMLPDTVDKLVEFRPSPFSFGYIYDYDDPDPCKEYVKQEKKEEIKRLVSVGTITEKHENQPEKHMTEELSDELSKQTKIKRQSYSLKNTESQTSPMSLDFLIEAYKCERKYSPTKDVFYPTKTNSNNVTSKPPRHIPPNIKSLSQSPMPSKTLPTNTYKSNFVLPEIPSFQSLSASKIAKNNGNNKNITKNSEKEFSIKEISDKKSEISMEFRDIVSQTTAVPTQTKITNGLHDENKLSIETSQNHVAKVIATVAPTMCYLSKPVPQALTSISHASTLSQKSPATVLKNTKNFETFHGKDTSKQAENTKNINIPQLSKDINTRNDKNKQEFTRLSDSPLLKSNNLPVSKTANIVNSKDHKNSGKYSTNSALQLFYQTIESRPPYSSIKSNPKSSFQNCRYSGGYKYNAYNFK